MKSARGVRSVSLGPRFDAPIAACLRHARSLDVLEVFADDIEEARERSGPPVLLPARYAFPLVAAPNCGSATACFLATFSTRRGGKAPSRTNVSLARGGYARGGCGASCAPSGLTFKRGGSVYRVTAKETKTEIVRP